MREVIVCPKSTYPISDELKVAEFNNGDTFKLVYHFYSLTGSKILDMDQFDFEAKFYIYGYESVQILFNKPSISGDTVIIDKKNCLLKFLFRDYLLNPGKLYYEYMIRYHDWDFNGNWAIDRSSGFTGIILN